MTREQFEKAASIMECIEKLEFVVAMAKDEDRGSVEIVATRYDRKGNVVRTEALLFEEEHVKLLEDQLTVLNAKLLEI